MSRNVLSELEPDATTAKRAQYEAFEFDLKAPGRVRVTNGSYGDESDDHTYTVTVEKGVPTSCECPADTYRSGGCKHRVAVAIREPVLEAAGAQSRQAATDGGVVIGERTIDAVGDGRPDDCDCLPTFDDLPCWPCYRDGFRSPNPNSDE